MLKARNLILILSLVGLTLAGLPTWAEPFKVPQLQDLQGEADAARLWNQGFRLEGDVLFESPKAVGASEVRLGRLRVIYAAQVFHWGETNYHEQNLQAGQISKELLKQLLGRRIDQTPKGYYVSVNPTDSIGYGPSLTVFEPLGPLVLLEFDVVHKNRFITETELVLKLAEGGVYGLRFPGYRNSWIATISSDALQRAQDIDKPLLLKMVENRKNLGDLLEAGPKLPFSDLSDLPQIPTGVAKALLGQELNVEDIAQLGTFDDGLPHRRILVEILRNLGTQIGSGRFRAALPLFKDIGVYDVRRTLEQWGANQAPPNLRYEKILRFIDMVRLNKELRSGKSVESLQNEVEELSARLASVDLKKIRKIDEFVLAAENFFGRTFEWRDQATTFLNFWPATENLYGLRTNSLLSYPVDRAGMISMTVQNAGLDQAYLFRNELPFDLRAELVTFYSQPSWPDAAEQSTPQARDLLKRILRKWTESILSGGKIYWSPDENLASTGRYNQIRGMALSPREARVRTFLSLQPFVSGNLELAFLMREYLRQVETVKNPIEILQPTDSAIIAGGSGVDLAGKMLRLWVSQAGSDAEFMQRNTEALELFGQAFPDLKRLL